MIRQGLTSSSGLSLVSLACSRLCAEDLHLTRRIIVPSAELPSLTPEFAEACAEMLHPALQSELP